MKWLTKRRLAKLAWILGGLMAAVFLLGYAIHLRSKDLLEEYKRKLRAAGEKLTIAELLPPPVPPERNNAEAFRSIMDVLKRTGDFPYSNMPPVMRMVAPGKAMVGWRQSQVRNDDASLEWEQTDLALAPYRAALDFLPPLVEQPVLDFDVRYQQTPIPYMSHLVSIKQSVRLLSASAVFNLHEGDPASAVTNARIVLAIVKGLQDERLVINQLVRTAIAQMALNLNWELLQSSDLTEEQLVALQRDLTETEFVRSGEDALQMERAFISANVAHLRGSNSPFSTLTLASGGGTSAGSGDWLDGFKSVWRGLQLKTTETVWKLSWSYSDELRALKGEQVLLDAMRQARTNGFFVDALRMQETKLAALGMTNLGDEFANAFRDPNDIDPRRLISESVGTLKSYLQRIMTTEAARQLTLTAVALKRYRLRHLEFPAELSALVPEFLPAVPRDPVDGKPLRYSRNADGTFLLYSVGEDGTDDGGDPASTKTSTTYGWQRGRDWVWPQPATPEEIQKFENEHRSGRP